MLTGTVMDFRRYAAFTGTIIEVSALRRDYWYSYRRFGVTPLLLVNSYRRFGLMSRLLEQLSTFRRYAVLTGTVITFRPYAVFTGTVIDVSALRRAYWYIYRRFGVTPCSLVQLSTFRRDAVFTGTVIDVSKDRSAFTFGSPSPGRVSADRHLHQRHSQNLTLLRRSPRQTFAQNCVNVTCRAGPECRRFLSNVLFDVC